MIRLTAFGAPEQFCFFNPAYIANIVEYGGDTHVTLAVEGVDSIKVVETPEDVTRLIAAWERRYTTQPAVENNDLPIFCCMTENGIGFSYCKHTAALNAIVGGDPAILSTGDGEPA